MEYKYYKVRSQLFFQETYYYRVHPDDTYDWWDEEIESWEGQELGFKFSTMSTYYSLDETGNIEEVSPLLVLILFGKRVVE